VAVRLDQPELERRLFAELSLAQSASTPELRRALGVSQPSFSRLVKQIAWLELFGRLIANTDMHGGNLSFRVKGSRVEALAPVYDMLPAHYAGQQGHLGSAVFRPPSPAPAFAGFWDPASRAALDLWLRLAKHASVSLPFRRIAAQNAELVEAFRKAARLLPGPTS
jgi:hypothetical protein